MLGKRRPSRASCSSKEAEPTTVTGMNWGAVTRTAFVRSRSKQLLRPTTKGAKSYSMCSIREAVTEHSLQFSGFLFKLSEPREVFCGKKGRNRGIGEVLLLFHDLELEVEFLAAEDGREVELPEFSREAQRRPALIQVNYKFQSQRAP